MITNEYPPTIICYGRVALPFEEVYHSATSPIGRGVQETARRIDNSMEKTRDRKSTSGEGFSFASILTYPFISPKFSNTLNNFINSKTSGSGIGRNVGLMRKEGLVKLHNGSTEDFGKVTLPDAFDVGRLSH